METRFAADETALHLQPPKLIEERYSEDNRPSLMIYEFTMLPFQLSGISKSKEYYGATAANWRDGWQGIAMESVFNCIVTKTPQDELYDGNQVVYAHDNYPRARTHAGWVNLFDDGSPIRAVLSIRWDQSDSRPKKGKPFITIRPRSSKVVAIRFEVMDAKDIELGETVQMIWDATFEICPERVRARRDRLANLPPGDVPHEAPQAASTSY